MTAAEARTFYDAFGVRQDRQGWYEDPALDLLVAEGLFSAASSVVELGCGTGRLAERLLSSELPATARYLGLDLSPTMVGLAAARLERFGARARVELGGGPPSTGLPDGAVDRFVSTYVLDLLSEEDARAVVAEAARVLERGGLLCLAGLSRGVGPGSRLVAWSWAAVHRLRPSLVGGCRPVELAPLLAGGAWSVEGHHRVAPWGVPSEVVVARRA